LAVLISIIAKKLSSTDPSVISKEASFYSLILVVFGSLISFIKNYFFLYEGENMMNKIKLVMFDKFIKMDISFYYNNENKQVKLMNYIEIETLIIHSYSLGVLVFFLDTESA
jgi:ABC-type multidrug transport system fused ATPase/permease subunit